MSSTSAPAWTAERLNRAGEAGAFEGWGKVELWDGALVVDPMRPPHVFARRAIARLLRERLADRDDCFVDTECPVVVDPRRDALSQPEPDVVVLAGDEAWAFRERHPRTDDCALVVEVVHRRDLAHELAKAERYVDPLPPLGPVGGVWVVDLVTRTVHVFPDATPDTSGRLPFHLADVTVDDLGPIWSA